MRKQELIQKQHPHFYRIIKEMFLAVGGDIEQADLERDDWFTQYMWTEDEQERYRQFLVSYLKEEKGAFLELCGSRYKSKRNVERAASEILFNWGWSTKT